MKTDRTLERKIKPPEGFRRIDVKEGSFAEWLRGLPLKHPCEEVRYRDGSRKLIQAYHVSIVDLDVLRFQECADTIIRLQAEYLWSKGRGDDLCYRFTSGDKCCWTMWKEGWRPRIKNNRVIWEQTGTKDDSRAAFGQYMVKVFEYAGTTSLLRDLEPIRPGELQPGDVIIEMGHCVMVLDMVVNDAGEKRMLLGQGFMPAQDLHIIKQSVLDSSPWYKADVKAAFKTIEYSFGKAECRRLR
ncbi:DUF4846 domain-containing protein [Acidobacteriota bacterium]